MMPIPNNRILYGLRVLVVDDDLDSCAWLTCALDLYGIKAQAVSSVSHALKAFVQFCPDIVLTDIAMPGEDGYVLLSQIRHIEAKSNFGKSVPVVALTGLPEPTDRFQTLEFKFDYWLLKPVDLDRLLGVIVCLIDRARMKQESFFVC